MNKSTLLIKTTLIFIFSTFLITANAASKSDQAKEKRWENQVVDSLLVGESIKLKADGNGFLALYAESTTNKPKGAVIILHGIGAHPAWPDVIDPLRMQLPEHGWHTLSLQMPILGNEATDKDYPPVFPEVPGRIQAGVDFLKARGISNIVLSGHSMGAAMASYYLANKPDSQVKTFAIVSGGPGLINDPLMDIVENLKKIDNVNIIDIYGGEDHIRVTSTYPKRKRVAKQMNKPYQLLKVDGANHFYHDKQNELVKTLSTQLDKLNQD